MAANKAEIEIIYEDAEMLVVNKPAGWVVTREKNKSNDNQKYIEDWVEEYYPNTLLRKGIVHRLDKGTSGVLVIAKTPEALEKLKKQFRERGVKKHYLALAGGDLPAEGEINMPINRSKYSFGKFKVDEEGKKAVTEFKLLKKIKLAGKLFSLVDINLKTGRTHQIRVHMTYLGWPLAGDKIYGGMAVTGLNRPFLHAGELTIKQPRTEKLLTFKADIPSDLLEVINRNED
jgi:23S rRNA pseudouridine1911/1915/1917 synthase